MKKLWILVTGLALFVAGCGQKDTGGTGESYGTSGGSSTNAGSSGGTGADTNSSK